jgi:hypothetical protein
VEILLKCWVSRENYYPEPLSNKNAIKQYLQLRVAVTQRGTHSHMHSWPIHYRDVQLSDTGQDRCSARADRIQNRQTGILFHPLKPKLI